MTRALQDALLRHAVERMRLLNSDRLTYGPEHFQLDSEMSEADVDSLLREGKSPLRRLDRLRGLFRKHGKLTRAEIDKILGVSLPTATSDLKALTREGFIRKVTPTRSPQTHYFEIRH